MARDARVDRLTEALTRLAEAQARTEGQLAQLTMRVDQLAARVDQLALRVDQLAAAQARTEDQLARLTTRVDQLAAAQARTEDQLARLTTRVDQLAEAQARTEARLEQLAAAQARTEEAVRVLAQQVGRLSETIGFTLEDLAREVTPAYLAQHFAIRVSVLDRRFFTLDGQEVEVDLFGEGTRDGEPIAVVGEVRSRIYGEDVQRVAQRALDLAGQLPGRPVVVLFGFVIHPSAREAAARLGAIVISSSGR
ncbi:MAG: hypothetical protein RB148_04275 [Armatimonadota bacterium]|nr:hypothetical protein [Armatimonadota bacterium]MDR7427236.1 hypothetical protein [Armatimonadota bacterium]MDR7473943.1 hypothetical protein [Armatimonadota bacterium]